jgi:hypothetical protein
MRGPDQIPKLGGVSDRRRKNHHLVNLELPALPALLAFASVIHLPGGVSDTLTRRGIRYVD